MQLTSISVQPIRQVRLLFSENVEEFVEIGDTSASKKLEQFVIAVMWLCNVDKVISLSAFDTLNITKPIEKCTIRLDVIQQTNKIGIQLPLLAFIQWSTVTKISPDICTSVNRYLLPLKIRKDLMSNISLCFVRLIFISVCCIALMFLSIICFALLLFFVYIVCSLSVLLPDLAIKDVHNTLSRFMTGLNLSFCCRK